VNTLFCFGHDSDTMGLDLAEEKCPQCCAMMCITNEPNSPVLWFSCDLRGFRREYLRPVKQAALSGSEVARAIRMNGLRYLPVLTPRCEPGLGAWRAATRDGGVSSGRWKRQLSAEEVQQWLDSMSDPGINSDESFLTTWNADAGGVEIVFGSAESVESQRAIRRS
jgi:hypothetical protein